jgi:hypothetical protein
MHNYSSVPPTATVRIELEEPLFGLVEGWRRSQLKIPSRSEAVRRLLAFALSARPNGPRPPELRGQRTTPSHITTNSQKLERVQPPSPA